MKHRNEKLSRKAAILLMICLAAAMVFTSCGNPEGDNPSEGYRNIKVESCDGSVTVNDELAYANLLLSGDDRVLVAENSSVVISLDGDKFLHIGEESELILKAEGTAQHTKTNIYVVEGETLIEVKNKLAEDESFFITSTNSVMAIRGTVVGINVKKVSGKQVAAYTVYKGKTDLVVMDKTEDGKIISSKLESLTDGRFSIEIPDEKAIETEEVINMSEQMVDETLAMHNTDAVNESLDMVVINRSETPFTDQEKVFDKLVNDFSDKEIVITKDEYNGVFDGLIHSSSVSTDAEGAVIEYSTDGSTFSTGTAGFADPGEYTVYFRITADGYSPKVGTLKVTIKPNDDICLVIGHDYADWKDPVPATCTKDGTAGYYTCSVCKGKFDADKNELGSIVLKALGHDVTKHEGVDPTCTQAGTSVHYTCSHEPDVIYGDKECTIVIESTELKPLGHDVTKHEGKAATCTDSGSSEYYTCSRESGKYFADEECTKAISDIVIPATGHNASKHEGKAATCTEDGLKTYYTCSNPGCADIYYANEYCSAKIDDIVIKAAGHKLGNVVAAVAATCKADGNVAYCRCSTCGKTFDETGENEIASITVKGEHNYGAFVPAVEATCTQNGNMGYYQCSVCNAYFDERKTAMTGSPLIKASHDLKMVGEQAATCTSDGVKAHIECNKCGEWLEKGASEYTVITNRGPYIIAALGHDIEMLDAVFADCVTKSKAFRYTCTRCSGGKYYRDYNLTEFAAGSKAEVEIERQGNVDPVRHKGFSIHIAGYATCIEDGYTEDCKECSGCGKFFILSDTTYSNPGTASDFVIPANERLHKYGAIGDGSSYQCSYCKNVLTKSEYDDLNNRMYGSGTIIDIIPNVRTSAPMGLRYTDHIIVSSVLRKNLL